MVDKSPCTLVEGEDRMPQVGTQGDGKGHVMVVASAGSRLMMEADP